MSLCARIVDHIARGIERTESSLRTEQAVVGLDMLDERELQALAASSLAEGGWGVHREVPYPTAPRINSARSERDRCDIVLTPEPGQRVADAVESARMEAELRATLFADVDRPESDTGLVVQPSDAIWIELKTTGQFTCRDGIGGPNRAYSSELVRGPLTDARKLLADSTIDAAVVVLILFAANEASARHDVAMAVHRMLDAGSLVVSTEVDVVPIVDRIGNSVCAIVGIGLGHRSPNA